MSQNLKNSFILNEISAHKKVLSKELKTIIECEIWADTEKMRKIIIFK